MDPYYSNLSIQTVFIHTNNLKMITLIETCRNTYILFLIVLLLLPLGAKGIRESTRFASVS
jgi:hypothetical protein